MKVHFKNICPMQFKEQISLTKDFWLFSFSNICICKWDVYVNIHSLFVNNKCCLVCCVPLGWHNCCMQCRSRLFSQILLQFAVCYSVKTTMIKLYEVISKWDVSGSYESVISHQHPALFKWHYILNKSHSQHEILFQGYEQYECGDCEGILFFWLVWNLQ